MRTVSAADAKAHFSELLSEVAHGDRVQIVIERHGKPVAALVGMDDLARLKDANLLASEPQGALALVGAWAEMGDDEIDEMVRDIYEQRERDMPRPFELAE